MKENTEANLIERGVSALLAFHNRNAMPVEEEVVIEEPLEEGHINIFSKPALGDSVKRLVGSDFERFSQPLINRSFLKDKTELLERVLGRSSSQANSITKEIIKDMLLATDYPPSIEGIFLEPAEVIAAAEALAAYVKSLQDSEGEG